MAMARQSSTLRPFSERERGRLRLYLVVAALTSVLPCRVQGAVGDEPDTGWIDRNALEMGEILVRTEKDLSL